MIQKTMPSMYRLIAVLLVGFAAGVALAQTGAAQDKEIRLILRADDMGSCHAANEACIQCFRKGIVQSVEVMVPGPWYAEAVRMLKDNPGLDVGVHLTLTSEWQFYKWGPVTHAPSLVDRHGHFYPATSQRQTSRPTPASSRPTPGSTRWRRSCGRRSSWPWRIFPMSPTSAPT